MVEAKIECFGEPSVSRSGDVVALRGSQPLTLAVLAAAGPRGISKEALYNELFWDNPQRSGEQAGVMRVQRLSNKLGEYGLSSALVASGPRLGITSSVPVDIWEFEDGIASTSIDRRVDAVLSYSEPFSGLVCADTPLLNLERERLRTLYFVALARLADSPVGVDGEIIERLRNAIVDSPFNETLVAGAARALYRAGQQAEALAAIDGCRRRLLEEKGLNPGVEIDRVEYAILHHDSTVLATESTEETEESEAPVVSAVAASAVARPERLVGQDSMVSQLGDEIGSAAAGGASANIVVVRGPAGYGKTSIVGHVTALLATRGVTILAGATSPVGAQQTASLYQPFLEVTPALDSAIADLQSGSSRQDLWQRAHRLICEAAEHGPTVIVLEDFHDADSQSLALLRFLALSSRPDQLVLVLTARPVPDDTPWGVLLAELLADGRTTLHDVPPLDLEAIQQIVAMDHPARPAMARDRFARSVHEKSQGNPLVATAFSGFSGPDLDPLLLPESLNPEDGYADHLRSLTEDDVALVQVLGVAGIIGLFFDDSTIEAVLDLPIDAVRDKLETASDLRICQRLGLHTWRFDHLLTVAHFLHESGVMRSFVYERLARLGTEDPLRMLRYVKGAQAHLDDDFVGEQLTWAGDMLERQSAFVEAALAWETLVELFEEDGEARLDALIRLAGSRSRTGDFTGARQLRASAVDLARRCGSARGVVDAALAGLPAGEHVGGEHDRLDVLFDLSDEERATIEPVDLARWKLRFARINEDTSRVEQIVREIDESWASSHGGAWTELQIEVCGFRSHQREAKDTYEVLADLEPTCPQGEQRAELLHRMALAALIEQQSKQAALEVIDRAAAEARLRGSSRTRWAADVLSATVGQIGLRDSGATPDTARASGHRWGIADAEDSWFVQLFMQLWLDGNVGLAQGVIDSVSDEIAMNVAWYGGLALSAAMNNDPERAAVEMAQVVNGIESKPDGLWSALAAALLAEAAWIVGDAAMAEVATETLSPRSERALVLGGGSAHFGPVDRYLGLAAATQGRSDAAQLLDDAVQQASRAGTSRWADRVKSDLEAVRLN